jgi:hypothetical protein
MLIVSRRLAVGRRLLPARLHCAASLVSVARAGDVYVPAAPVVLEVRAPRGSEKRSKGVMALKPSP